MLGWLIGWLFEVATVARAERRARDPAEIERELQRIDETLHNIEGCTLQLQGKMLTLGVQLERYASTATPNSRNRHTACRGWCGVSPERAACAGR